jgi:hypothetical protein
MSYEARATEHMPKTPEEMRAAVRRMLADGSSDYGTAAALRIAVEQVRRFAALSAETERRLDDSRERPGGSAP